MAWNDVHEPGMDGESGQHGGVQSVERALAVREILARDGHAGVSDIAEEMGIHKSTVSRLLGSLVSREMVQQNNDRGKYQLGFGILRLAADFAQAVLDAGLTWIGPAPEAIRLLGNKITAREIAVRAGAPLVAGSDGPVASAAEARAFAEERGLPIAIKAAFGGVGRGLMVERYLDRPRHVEAQVLTDRHGTSWWWERATVRSSAGTRSWWRRLRRPSSPHSRPGRSTTPPRQSAAKPLIPGPGQWSSWWPPITEETAGDSCPRREPSPFCGPTGPGIRLDSGVRAGSIVAPQFDSLLAKLIVTGADRQQALRRARRALAEMEITGMATVLPFHRAVVLAPDFTSEAALRVHTRWIETGFAGSIPADPGFGTSVPDGVRRTITVDVDGRRHAVGLPAALLDGWARSGAGVSAGVALSGHSWHGEHDGGPAATAADPGELRADMAGTVVKWLVEPGAEVAAGDPVVVLEAMKMETQVAAHRGGTVRDIRAEAGGVVNAGAVLATISD